MFTGIVQKVGRVVRADRTGGRMVLCVELGQPAAGLAVGGSVAVDGVCLTATAVSGGQATLDVGAESLRLTTLGDLRPGDRINVELPVRAGEPLGGHIVQGHVDGRGMVSRILGTEDGKVLRVSASSELTAQMALKGSVAVDGVSLTISALRPDAFETYLVPHTLKATTLGQKKVGDPVNIETDIIGKYVARYLRKSDERITEKTLEEHGFK